MKKSFIVEDVTANLNKITCLTDEIKEGIEFRCLNAIGVWHTEGKDEEGDLWDKVAAYRFSFSAPDRIERVGRLLNSIPRGKSLYCGFCP